MINLVNFLAKLSLISAIVIISTSCNSLDANKQEQLLVKKNIDLRDLNPSAKHDQDIIQVAEELAILHNDSDNFYTGFNMVEINDYKILYNSAESDGLLVYHNDKVLAKLVGNAINLYQDDSYLPYVNKQAVYYNNKENEINYTNGSIFFSDFNLDGVDGIYKIDEVENKAFAAISGGGITPQKLFYKGQECEMLMPDGISCCMIDGKKELMYLNSNGWEKIEPNDKFSCD